MKNPNFFPVGDGLGLFVNIRDISHYIPIENPDGVTQANKFLTKVPPQMIPTSKSYYSKKHLKVRKMPGIQPEYRAFCSCEHMTQAYDLRLMSWLFYRVNSEK